jgi:hypothetical protein
MFYMIYDLVPGVKPQDDKREHRDGKDDCGITKVLGNKKSPI